MGYNSSRTKIQQTLTGRTSGTQVTPDSHQAMAEDVLNYVQEVENISLSGLEGIAYTDTTPVQPDEANCAYISAVPSNTTYTYKNFADENGDAVSITATTDPLFVILFWNKKYWSYLATTSAPHLHISAELTDSNDEVPSSKAVSESIDAEGKARQTADQTLKESIDAEVQDYYKKSNYNDGDSIIDFNTIHIITDNPEFVCVAVDVNEKILYGIKTDGQPYFGVGCPQQVKDYIDKQINKILGTDDISSTIDSLKEIEAFLKDFTNSDTLKKLLDLKANVDEVRATTDDIYKKSNYNDGDNIIDFNTIHLITDNPEFAIAAVDANDRILYGIKADGQPCWGVGVPKVVRDYVDKQVNDILGTDNITETIDSLKEVEKFLSDFKNSDTLKALLDTKANKTDVDNTVANINADIADKYKKSNPNDEEGNVIDTNSIKSVINNPEYFKAFVDNTNKLIEAIGLDGVRKFFAGINIQGIYQCVTNNPDYLVAWVDKENKIIFAIQHDGNPYFGYGVPKQITDEIKRLFGQYSTANAIEIETNDDNISAYIGKNGNIDADIDDNTGDLNLYFDPENIDIKNGYELDNGDLVVETNKVITL